MLDKYHLNYLYIGEILLDPSIIIDVKAPIYTVLTIFYWIGIKLGLIRTSVYWRNITRCIFYYSYIYKRPIYNTTYIEWEEMEV